MSLASSEIWRDNPDSNVDNFNEQNPDGLRVVSREEDKWFTPVPKFNKDLGTLTLELGGQDDVDGIIDEDILSELTKLGFELKDDLHITVLNYENGERIRTALEQYSKTGQGIILRDIERAAHRQDWSWRASGELYPFLGKGRKDNKLKLITPVECSGVTDFYAYMEQLLPDVEIVRHPMHITIMKSRMGLSEGRTDETGALLNRHQPLRTLGNLALGYHQPSRTASIRNLESPNKRELFPRDTNGLIDYDAYLEFLIDSPDRVPVEISDEQQAEWIAQHMYYRNLFYTQKGETRHVKDKALSSFVNMPYNQVIMRREKEIEIHQRKDRHVIVPPPETIRDSLVDFSNLDIIGAAALGRRISLIPEALEDLLPGTGLPKRTPYHSPLEKALFFDERMEKALEALNPSLVTPQRIVTGAIARMARILNNERLQIEAKVRLARDPIYLPVRLRSLGFLKQLSEKLLSEIELEEIAEDEIAA